MGSITLTPLRDTAVDFSYPYFYNHLGFISKKPSTSPKLIAIFWPYQKMVWITIAAMVPFFSLTYWSISTVQPEERGIKSSFGAVFEEASKMLVMQGMNMIQRLLKKIPKKSLICLSKV